MLHHMPRLAFRLAATDSDIALAQALRFTVFVQELGGRGGDQTDPAAALERDRFDPHCRHLLLFDTLRSDEVIGTTRVLTAAGAQQAGQFATEEEFDLSALRRSGRTLLEVGRTCLHADYRKGAGMQRLWQGVATVVAETGADLLFGLASLPGTDLASLAQPLSILHHEYLAPETLRPRSRKPLALDLLPPDRIDQRAAMRAMPPLIKAYLRLGGQIGEGAFRDDAFNCIDVCMVLDTARLTARARSLYAGEGA